MASLVENAIKSGDYKWLFDAIKGFRNGLVYGCKVRAPHSLVMNLLFSRDLGPNEMAKRIFNATKQHGMNLAKFAFVFKSCIGILAKAQGGPAPWHAFVVGGLCGYLFWGENSPVNVQVNMYLLSRIISGFLFLLMTKYQLNLGPSAFRLYASLMWACVMFLFYHYPNVLQNSLQTSMNYIYRESDRYSNFNDLVLVNSPKTF